MEKRPVRHVPLVGDVAAGTDVLAEQNVEELLPVPADFAGEGELFMLRVRGDSMIDDHICDGDVVVLESREVPREGETVVALINREECTLKRFHRDGGKVTLMPANPNLKPMVFPAEDVEIQGVVIGVLRRFN